MYAPVSTRPVPRREVPRGLGSISSLSLPQQHSQHLPLGGVQVVEYSELSAGAAASVAEGASRRLRFNW
jgi:hypothetical protein